MKLATANSWLTLAANVGVLAGIVFLAVELHQNNELMADEARRARAASVQGSWAIIAENRELAELLVKDRNGETLTQVESLRLMATWLRSLTDLELAYRELPAEELGPVADRYRSNFDLFPSLVATWNRNRQWFQPDFAAWLDEINANQ